MKRRLLSCALLPLALLAPGSGFAFGPGNPPPGVDEFHGGPIALDLIHDRIFLCDSANNRVLVYDVSAGGLGDAPLAVIGQPDAQCNALNGTGEVTPNDRGLAFPDGVAYDATRNGLWVSDFLNHRVLFFDCRALQNQPAARLVVGQPDFTSNTAGTGQRGFSGPAGLALSFDDRWLAAADMLNHRVLAFDLEQADDFLAAAVVVGQDDFSGCEPGTSAQTLRAPSGVAIDANNQLYVADTGNNRVVVFDGNAELTGASAYVVFGQPDFNSAIPAAGVDGLNAPVAVGLDEVDGWFFVADTGNNRVVAYDGNASNPLTARGIIGQPDTESSAPQPAARGLDMPLGLLFDIIEQRLWVSEGGSARVGVYKLGGQ